MLESRHSTTDNDHYLLLERLTPKQWLNIKDPIVNANNRLNEIFNSFNPFSCEFSPGNRLINIFPSHFSFHLLDRKNVKSKKAHMCKLNKLILQASVNPRTAVIVSNASIKNQVAMSIAHIHVHDNPVIKTLHHAINVTSTEAELFAIRCGLNQATQLNNIEHIIVIMDFIHAAKRIFNSSIYPYQVQTLSISKELREFFKRDYHNSIEFWECPSQDKWFLHNIVDKEFNLIPIFPCKSSWQFSWKTKCDEILNTWKMTFQASDAKGRNFLELLDDDSNIIELTYFKGGSWLKYFGHSNSLCVRASRAIIPTGEYCLRFFPREEFTCPCGQYPIETRHHILHECKQFNKYWNQRWDTVAQFTLFLEFNSQFAHVLLNPFTFLFILFFLSFLFFSPSLFLLHVVSIWMYVATL